jgi:signal transduction histidine kinase
MLKSLNWKIALAFMLVAFTTAALVAVFIRVTSADRLTRLIIEQQRGNLVAALSNYYAANDSWNGVAASWRNLQVSFNPPGLAPATDRPPTGEIKGGDRGSLFGLADADGMVIVSIQAMYPRGALLPARLIRAGTPISVDGEQVGTLLTSNRLNSFNPEEAMFLQRTNQALLMGILGAMLVALILGIVLASGLTRPLKALTQAAQSIAQGNLEQKVVVNSEDEIGQLATAFNQMSEEVARVNQLRRQMTADIAHDLRTPLTVIGGYVEAMRDGVLQPTEARLTMIYTEIERLQDMVGDLRMLSQADAGELPLHPQSISPRALLERSAALFQHKAEQQQVQLSVTVDGDLPDILVDEARLMQVLDNLLSNAFRYTPTGGKIHLSAAAQGDKVIISVQDNGSGISSDELPHIFDRFHRGDKSRHTEAGESGLGLAIVKALVEAHHGTIRAESHVGEGTTIFIEIPA